MSENLEFNVPNENSVLEEKTIIGIVTNCIKLNVRENPTKSGEVKCILNAGTEVIIDIEKYIYLLFIINNILSLNNYKAMFIYQ